MNLDTTILTVLPESFCQRCQNKISPELPKLSWTEGENGSRGVNNIDTTGTIMEIGSK